MRLNHTIPVATLLLVIAAAGFAAHHGDAKPAETPFSIDSALAGDWRSDAERSRDPSRHPREVLEFFGLGTGLTVVEISPGGGWYTKILAPYVNRTGGTFFAAGFDPKDESAYAQRGLRNFQTNFIDQPELYGKIEVTVAGPNSEGIAPDGSADLVLTFRSAHSWVTSGYAEKVFADIFRALAPGGVLGVVDHRLPAERAVPETATGYLHEATVIALAEEAGFVLEASSTLNDNAADSADHPFGVWTLPPTARSSPFGKPDDPDFDRAHFDAIGESDRFTLRFRKPSD